MRVPIGLALLALAVPAAGQRVATPDAVARDFTQLRVTTRIVVVDREALRGAGLDYVVLGKDRVRVRATGRRTAAGARVRVGTQSVGAFLEAVGHNRWIRREATQRVLALSGRPGAVASTDLSERRGVARKRGPVLEVVPTALGDSRIHLRVSARIEDSVRYGPWGYGVDGSPAVVETEVIARDGEELLLASSSSVETTREAGLLRWTTTERGRDVLVAVTADVVTATR